MRTVVFQKGDVIFSEGDAGESMFLLQSGCVGIYADHGKPGEKKLTELRAGDAFGEMSILEAEPRSVTAVSLENGTELNEVGVDEFDAFLQDHPDRVRGIMVQMSRRIRDLTNDYMDVCRTVVDIHETEEKGEAKSEDLNDRMSKIVNIYQNRFPALFNITMKEAKDDVRFVFTEKK